MSFAHTKIQRPRPRAGLLLPRPALEGPLVEALCTQRAVLVCAAAGFGKTALLARALEQLPPGHAVAWVSLDPGDDLERLLECLVAALEPFDPPWRSAPEGLIAAAARAGERTAVEVVDEFVNTLQACDVPRGVIALDDLHHVDDAAALAFLDLMLQRLGERWCMALAARHEPALRLARLRAAGELAEMRETQLRFGADEARALLAGGGVEGDAADALYRRTGGWAAGLRLALSGARGGSPGSAIDRQAFDFLATEVLARIDPDLRQFLLQTSVLHDLDAGRCAQLTGDSQAAFWLDEIERLGLFASVVGESPRTLHLHDLFRDALQHRLRLERSDEWLPLHERAATLESDTVRRQALLLAAQRLDLAARALLAAEATLITQGGVNTLLRLHAQFPPEYADHSAELQQVAGRAKWTVWEAHQAERHLARAAELYGARGDHAAANASRAQQAIALIGIGRLAAAGGLLDSLQGQPLQGDARNGALLAATWHAMESGSFHAVARHFDALVGELQEQPVLGAWFPTVPAPRQTTCRGIAGALVRWATGVFAVTGDRPLPLRASALQVMGWVALWRGQFEDAAQWLQRADADAQWTGQQVVGRSQSLALHALLDAFRGNSAAALEATRTRIAEFATGYGHWGMWHMLFFASRLALVCGDLQSLRDWLQRLKAMEPLLPDATPARLMPLVGLQATLDALEGRPQAAVEGWRLALAHEEHSDLMGQAAELRMRLAAALLRRGAAAEAAAHVQAALAHAGEGPCGALFAGAVLRELAAADWQGRLSDAESTTLQHWAGCIRGAGDHAEATSTAATASLHAIPPAPASVDRHSLTARELEVLALIAKGDSNKLIARALDLSPFTVKRHVAHILDKLDLASRGQAAAWYHARADGTQRSFA